MAGRECLKGHLQQRFLCVVVVWRGGWSLLWCLISKGLWRCLSHPLPVTSSSCNKRVHSLAVMWRDKHFKEQEGGWNKTGERGEVGGGGCGCQGKPHPRGWEKKVPHHATCKIQRAFGMNKKSQEVSSNFSSLWVEKHGDREQRLKKEMMRGEKKANLFSGGNR